MKFKGRECSVINSLCFGLTFQHCTMCGHSIQKKGKQEGRESEGKEGEQEEVERGVQPARWYCHPSTCIGNASEMERGEQLQRGEE